MWDKIIQNEKKNKVKKVQEKGKNYLKTAWKYLQITKWNIVMDGPTDRVSDLKSRMHATKNVVSTNHLHLEVDFGQVKSSIYDRSFKF